MSEKLDEVRRTDHRGVFFFSSRRRHTRFDCDWSSDVCSSDLSTADVDDADVLLLDEPTRGIDIGSRAQLYETIARCADAGKAVLLVSSYLPEQIGRASCRERV